MKFKNSLLALAALAMVGGVGTGVALGNSAAVETKADDTTLTMSQQGWKNAELATTLVETGFTLSWDKGTNENAPKYYNTGSAVRCYGGNQFTFTPDESCTLTAIAMTFDSGEGSNAITADSGTFENNTWSGSADSALTFTVGGTTGHRRIQAFAVTFSSGVSTCTVTYDGNGATGGSTSDDTVYDPSDEVTVLDCGFTKEYFDFVEWNTKADGSGDSYDPGDTFQIAKNTTLYAQWDYVETELDDGAYSVTLGYQNPIPTILQVKNGSEETVGLVSLEAANVMYKDKYKEYALATASGTGTGVITLTNHTNAVITKLVLKAYMYDNYNVYADGVSVHTGAEGTSTSGGDPYLIEIDLNAENTVIIENSYASGAANLYGLTLYMRAGNEEIHVTSVSLNADAGDVYIGKTRQLTASVLPLDADDRSVSWSSSDEGIATVSDTGLVTGVAEGVATITATTVDGGFEATFEANVKEVFYGSEINPLTPEQAFEVLQIADTTVSEEPLCVRGVVGASKYNSNYSNWEIWLKSSDGTNVKFFELYRTLFDEEAELEDIYQNQDAMIGLTVTASGYGKMYSSTPELSFENSVAPVVNAVAFSAQTFADSIIMLTKSLCDAYEDESAYATRRLALIDIWESLEAKYGTLPSADVNVIAEADADEEGTLIEQAMARYDYLTGKYELDNFITGRTPVSQGRVPSASVSAQQGSMIAILVTLISVSVLATGGFVLARKKRKN